MSKFDRAAKRKELQQLNKSKLIKECKKYKINTYTGKLSKIEMIQRLLPKIEAKMKEKYEKKQKIKAMKKEQFKMTPMQHYTTIIHGMFRESDISQIFPDVISQRIAQYIEIIRIFDTCPNEFKYAIQNYGTFINRKKNIGPLITKRGNKRNNQRAPCLFGVSSGFKRGTKDNIFKVKVYKNNSKDSIGIISNLDCCKEPFMEIHRLYHPVKGARTQRKVAPRFRSHAYYEQLTNVEEGGIVEINVNMIEWWIRFYIDGEDWGKLTIHEVDIYYPVIATITTSKYKLLL